MHKIPMASFLAVYEASQSSTEGALQLYIVGKSILLSKFLIHRLEPGSERISHRGGFEDPL